MPLIQLGGHRGGERYIEPVFAEIDQDDLEKVSAFVWSQNNRSNSHTTYAQTTTGGKKIHLHRLIMDLGDYSTDKRIINHKDGNGLNNKKENLEICDILYNSQSCRRRGNKGCVYADTSMLRAKIWRATITLNKKIYKKRFYTKKEAEDWLQNIINTHQQDGSDIQGEIQ